MTMPNVNNQESVFNVLPIQISQLIFQFLTYNDMAKFELTCKAYNKIINREENWRTVTIQANLSYDLKSQISSTLHCFQKWIINKVQQCKPRSLNFNDSNYWQFHDLELLFKIENQNLNHLRIYYDLQQSNQSNNNGLISSMHEMQSECLLLNLISNNPNVKHFTYSGSFITEKSTQYLKHWHSLSALEFVSDQPDITGEHLCQIVETVKEMNVLFIRPYNVVPKYLQLLITAYSSTLKQLSFDCTNFSAQEAHHLLSSLDAEQISVLKLNFCENFSDQTLFEISKFQNLRQFKISKANNCSEKGFIEIFKRIHCQKLEKIVIDDCFCFCDFALDLISQAAKNLKKITISWSNLITSEGVSTLFSKCNKIEKCKLIGLNHLNENAFMEVKNLLPFYKLIQDCIKQSGRNITKSFLEQNNIDTENFFQFLRNYQRLNFLDLTKSAAVPDDIIYFFKLLKPRFRGIGYYGDEL